MNINRHNYEEFFLMYADNELTATDRAVVEAFVMDHPDLKTELEMLLQTILPSDDRHVFNDKESLYRTTDGSAVNLTNYESYFIRYADDELTNEEKAATEQFVYRHPECEADFETIQRAKLAPDTSIHFPDKSVLYRSESGKRRPVIAPWMRYSAAAAVIILAAILWVNRNPGQPVVPDSGTIAITEEGRDQKNPGQTGVQPGDQQEKAEPGIGQTGGTNVNPAQLAAAGEKKPATRKAAGQPQADPVIPKRKTESLLASNSQEPVQVTNLQPSTEIRPSAEKTLPVPQVVAVAEKSKPDVAINQPVYVETNNTPNVVYTNNTGREDFIYVGTENISRKTPVRGLLRKAGRFLEQNNPLSTERKRSGVFTASNEQE